MALLRAGVAFAAVVLLAAFSSAPAAPSGPSVPRAVDTGTDALRWGGRLYVVTTDGERAFADLGGQVITLPEVPEPLSPLLYLLPAQLVGYHHGLSCYAAAVNHG